MRLTRRTRIQLAVLIVIAVIAGSYVALDYVRLPQMLFGAGQFTVSVDLPEASGLYENANVTYRGVEVGRVKEVRLTDAGVAAVLSLDSDVAIPANVEAQVHSVSAVGEQYVALLPRSGGGPALTDGATIPASNATVPPDINAILDATNRGLQAIPRGNLKTVIDEAAAGVAGLGPELGRIINGSTALAADANKNLDSLTTLIDQSPPILQSQADTADAIHAWAANLAVITTQVKDRDRDVAGLLDNGGPAAAQARDLFDRLRPTVPVLLANLVSGAQVAVTYQPALEQLLVLVPQATAQIAATMVPDMNIKGPYSGGAFLDFNLNQNLPPPCTTGFLPAQQRRPPSMVDYPDRPAGDLYCRVPQNASNDVRGARNLPCQTVPGKRAPTVKMCESKENFVPLNDGNNWKGDPNATLSGQDIPQLPPGVSRPPDAPPVAPAPPPVAFAPYDPSSGAYLGPDGQTYTQSDLANPQEAKTWQSMLTPPN
jgi:phospholipid/cholesterol/gamma-HCH transport system substrate-binding protein